MKPPRFDAWDARQDLSNADHLIQIKKVGKYKNAMCSRYGKFESRIIQLWLKNSLATTLITGDQLSDKQ